MFKGKHGTHVVTLRPLPLPRSGGCVVVELVAALCSSILGFAFWIVFGLEGCPDLPCCDTVLQSVVTITAASRISGITIVKLDRFILQYGFQQLII